MLIVGTDATFETSTKFLLALNLLQIGVSGHQFLESVSRETNGQLGIIPLALATNNHAHTIYGVPHVTSMLEPLFSSRFRFSSRGQINLSAALPVKLPNALNRVVSRSFVGGFPPCLSVRNILDKVCRDLIDKP